MLQIPSFANLLAFIAVGKRKSFRMAADDMMLTPGAISQKIKQLEGQVGYKLLNRSSRGVSFTEKGERYYTAILPHVESIAISTREVFGGTRKKTLVISTMPAFALRWLIPRLDSFHNQYSDTTVSISTTDRLVDFEADDVDMAIRHGLGHYPKLRSDRLFSEDLIPVCSPKLQDGPAPIKEPRDLQHHTLLHDNLAKDWSLFLDAIGEKSTDPNAGPRFDNDTLMIQSAIVGHGVALARASLISEELENGTLVALFDHCMPSEFAYYAVYPKDSLVFPELVCFRDWLLDQAEQYLKSEGGLKDSISKTPDRKF